MNVEKGKALPESTSSAESTKRLLQYVRKRNSICKFLKLKFKLLENLISL